jgi:2-polyprenyl-3-methyl-5-hydroxy-6-metoxy-1,4-benzoquinol methylase
MSTADHPASSGVPSADQRKHHWEEVYAAKAATEVSWFQPIPATSLAMIRASGIALDASVIDVGGGASTLVDHLLAAGYRSITVLDLAASALDVARRRLGQAADRIDWITADILTWRPAARFDLWHDRAVFHFLTEPPQRKAYLDTLKLALKPGGTAILATFALDGPDRCSGLPVQRYSPASLAAELGGEFTLVESASEEHLTPSGAVQRFVYCRFNR